MSAPRRATHQPVATTSVSVPAVVILIELIVIFALVAAAEVRVMGSHLAETPAPQVSNVQLVTR